MTFGDSLDPTHSARAWVDAIRTDNRADTDLEYRRGSSRLASLHADVATHAGARTVLRTNRSDGHAARVAPRLADRRMGRRQHVLHSPVLVGEVRRRSRGVTVLGSNLVLPARARGGQRRDVPGQRLSDDSRHHVVGTARRLQRDAAAQLRDDRLRDIPVDSLADRQLCRGTGRRCHRGVSTVQVRAPGRALDDCQHALGAVRAVFVRPLPRLEAHPVGDGTGRDHRHGGVVLVGISRIRSR